ncbi:MAG: tRNA epoxyqueuosine(34) reductase QueG [Gammaproteobacteria bacterium 28-57-27]|nr:MAG: tRNA epoxyqueuosine(34) reductase QueG [Gammaproteobacteria bacterium 28-57-27]
MDKTALVAKIKAWGRELGFQQVGIASPDLSRFEAGFVRWLDAGMHGEMDYMARHGLKRLRPAELQPGTRSVISVRMDYMPEGLAHAPQVLQDGRKAYISRYALGRDYHKLLRARLQKLAERIEAEIGAFGHRVFVDSAPVYETGLAENAGLGWKGKHSLVLSRGAGSWFFLGELLVELDLPLDAPTEQGHCGRCTACMDICPTQAIVADGVVDARLCISYLTIEYAGSIPLELRPLIGNRIYGCDDCQLICPWNRFAQATDEADFKPRHGLEAADVLDLWAWTEGEFLHRTEGSAIRRIGYERWKRNLAVALGNAPGDGGIVEVLQRDLLQVSPLVAEHMLWALEQQRTLSLE